MNRGQTPRAWLLIAMLLAALPASGKNCEDPYCTPTKGHHPTQTTPKVDLDQLITRLKQTSAIGFFTKIALRADVMQLQEKITAKRAPLPELRHQFDGLVLKILALLDDDPALARDIYRAREAIWLSLLPPSDKLDPPQPPRSNT